MTAMTTSSSMSVKAERFASTKPLATLGKAFTGFAFDVCLVQGNW